MQYRKGFAAIVAGTMTLSACTLEPKYIRPNAPVAMPEHNVVSGTAAEDLGWRAFFPDPQLQHLIVLALANNRDLRVATLNVQVARARYRIQRADLFPTIAASTTEQAERLPASVLAASLPTGIASPQGDIVSRSYTAGIGFTNFELDLFGRIRSLDHADLQQYFSFEETRRGAQISLVAEVANAYLMVLTDQTLLEITRQTLQNQSDSYELTRQMFERGTATELALRQAESTVDTARANSAQYARALAVDRDALQLLLGAPIPEGIDFSAGLDRSDVVSAVQEAIPSDVLVKRPDVLAAEHLLKAANADIGAARAAFFPAIELTGSLGSASTELSGLFKHDSLAWTFAPQISVPLFAGGANEANLRAAKVARDTAVAQYEKAIQIAFREVADALAARGCLDEQLAAQQALVSASQDAYHLAQMRFRGGVDNYLSELDAQRSLYDAQQQLQIVRLQRFENLVTLYKTLGGGLHDTTVTKVPVVG
ncbi:MAG: efflux transporter outer membrane subunit [Steroidobacteraceae bacterium]|jgi:multidrug efflux system outer membrane protein